MYFYIVHKLNINLQMRLFSLFYLCSLRIKRSLHELILLFCLLHLLFLGISYQHKTSYHIHFQVQQLNQMPLLIFLLLFRLKYEVLLLKFRLYIFCKTPIFHLVDIHLTLIHPCLLFLEPYMKLP